MQGDNIATKLPLTLIIVTKIGNMGQGMEG